MPIDWEEKQNHHIKKFRRQAYKRLSGLSCLFGPSGLSGEIGEREIPGRKDSRLGVSESKTDNLIFPGVKRIAC